MLLLNSDEEVGSPVSRPITERLARSARAVFVLEPAQGLAYKTARKGTGNWRIDVKGVAAHAGVDFEKGASAMRELARVVETVSGWTDLKRGLTVSVGVAGGGTKTQRDSRRGLGRGGCAHRAQGRRAAHRAQVRRAEGGGQALLADGDRRHQPAADGAHAAARWSSISRRARWPRSLGFALEEAATGGASDGNFTSALGIPTLDGMGAVGEGAHASHESVLVEHLAPRTALLAGMMIANPGGQRESLGDVTAIWIGWWAIAIAGLVRSREQANRSRSSTAIPTAIVEGPFRGFYEKQYFAIFLRTSFCLRLRICSSPGNASSSVVANNCGAGHSGGIQSHVGGCGTAEALCCGVDQQDAGDYRS